MRQTLLKGPFSTAYSQKWRVERFPAPRAGLFQRSWNSQKSCRVRFPPCRNAATNTLIALQALGGGIALHCFSKLNRKMCGRKPKMMKSNPVFQLRCHQNGDGLSDIPESHPVWCHECSWRRSRQWPRTPLPCSSWDDAEVTTPTCNTVTPSNILRSFEHAKIMTWLAPRGAPNDSPMPHEWFKWFKQKQTVLQPFSVFLSALVLAKAREVVRKCMKSSTLTRRGKPSLDWATRQSKDQVQTKFLQRKLMSPASAWQGTQKIQGTQRCDSSFWTLLPSRRQGAQDWVCKPHHPTVGPQHNLPTITSLDKKENFFWIRSSKWNRSSEDALCLWSGLPVTWIHPPWAGMSVHRKCLVFDGNMLQ